MTRHNSGPEPLLLVIPRVYKDFQPELRSPGKGNASRNAVYTVYA